MLMSYWSLLFSRFQVRLSTVNNFRQTRLDPNPASCARGERMWSITDAPISNRGQKFARVSICLGCHLFWDSCLGCPQGPWQHFPALSCYCVCIYPVSTPFPSCFCAFCSKLYSFYFLQPFLLNGFFFSPCHCCIFLTSCLSKLSQLFFLLNYTAHSCLQSQNYKNIGGVSLFLFLKCGVKLTVAIVQLQEKTFL